MTMKIWLNTKLVPENKASISVWDRGFLYGDGVYEAVRVYEGKTFRAEAHWKRLDNSLKGLALKVPWSHAALTRAVQAVIKANKLKESLIRITISRGPGAQMGYDPSTCKTPTLTVLPSHVRSDLDVLWKKGVKVSIANIRRNSTRSLTPAVKHTNCLNGILAKMESLKKGAFEGVFLNLEDDIVEGTISNIFAVKDGMIRTPALECGLLDGVTRRAIIEVAKTEGIPVVETHLKVFEILQADEVFLTSTTMEAMPVVQVDDTKIGSGAPGPVTERIRIALRRLIWKELGLTSHFTA